MIMCRGREIRESNRDRSKLSHLDTHTHAHTRTDGGGKGALIQKWGKKGVEDRERGRRGIRGKATDFTFD